MSRIVVGSLNLTQPLLLYPGLGPAMLEQHRRSYQTILLMKTYFHKFLRMILLFTGTKLSAGLALLESGRAEH
jgi:hypothetical protein